MSIVSSCSVVKLVLLVSANHNDLLCKVPWAISKTWKVVQMLIIIQPGTNKFEVFWMVPISLG